jgi:tripartite-type tricarboxylate transporter receptor subunit TctC
MKKIMTKAGAAIFAVSIAAAFATARTTHAEDFYAGKTIRMLVGYGAGTGNDLYMRLLARHLSDHIPGKPTIVPENRPGAASLVMANYLYNVAPRDGTVIGLPARNLVTEPLFGNEQAKYDARKFTWIGSMSRDTALCFTWHTTGIKTLDDAKKGQVLVGSTGAASNSSLFPFVLNELFGTKFKAIVGYTDSGAIGLAMERGELAGYCSFTLGGIRSARPQWLDQQQVNVLVQLTTRKHPDLPKVPSVMELTQDQSARQALQLVLGDQEMGRPVAGPPDMPADRLAILRKAFDDTVKDPAYIADAKATGVDIDGPITGSEVAKIIDAFYATPPAVIARVKKFREDSGAK